MARVPARSFRIDEATMNALRSFGRARAMSEGAVVRLALCRLFESEGSAYFVLAIHQNGEHKIRASRTFRKPTTGRIRKNSQMRRLRESQRRARFWSDTSRKNSGRTAGRTMETPVGIVRRPPPRRRRQSRKKAAGCSWEGRRDERFPP